MTDHVRKQIRDAAVTALTGLVTTTTDVYPTRMHRVRESQLPCLLIYTLSEQSEIDALSRPRGLTRQVDLAVEAVAVDNDTLDDTLDLICKEVEVALGNTTFGGLAKDVILTSTEVVVDGNSDKKTGAARMTWTVEYRTPENDPTTTI